MSKVQQYELDPFLKNIISILIVEKNSYQKKEELSVLFEDLKNFIINNSKTIKKFNNAYVFNGKMSDKYESVVKDYVIELLVDKDDFRFSIKTNKSNSITSSYEDPVISIQKKLDDFFINSYERFYHQNIYYNLKKDIHIEANRLTSNYLFHKLSVNNHLNYHFQCLANDNKREDHETLRTGYKSFGISLNHIKINKDVSTAKETLYAETQDINISVSGDKIIKSLIIDFDKLETNEYVIGTKTFFKKLRHVDSKFLIEEDISSIKDFPSVKGINLNSANKLFNEYKDIKLLCSDDNIDTKIFTEEQIKESVSFNKYLIDFMIKNKETIKKALEFKPFIIKPNMTDLDLSQIYSNLDIENISKIYNDFKNNPIKTPYISKRMR